jgi:hypothetical protein
LREYIHGRTANALQTARNDGVLSFKQHDRSAYIDNP